MLFLESKCGTKCANYKSAIYLREPLIFFTHLDIRLSLYVFSIFFPLGSVTSLACLFVSTQFKFDYCYLGVKMGFCECRKIMHNMIQENICEIQSYLLLNMTNCDLNVVVLINKWVSGGIVILLLSC